MKKWILLIGLLSYSSVGWSESDTTVLKCEVKTNSLITIKDGVPDLYQGYEKGYKKGDELIVSYSWKESFNGKEVVFKVRDQKRDTTNLFDVYDKPQSKNSTIENKHGDFIVVRDSRIRVKTTFGDVELERYYRGDWSGLLVIGPLQNEVTVSTLDCRTQLDGYESFLNYFGFKKGSSR
jgi:hypothetical protein